ncbi:S-adenosylmethionine decarboxylase proenzyme [mine drainage metagenome]|uniref:S-adenosylmethionine decarboxylase proenzyme n=1 Tax=mine drainage metagenome TaxID=410659 RepID=T1BAA6_9ZZZZ
MKNTTSTQAMQQIVKVIGKHVYGNLYGIELKNLTDLSALTKLVVDSAKAGNLHILELITKKFSDINGIPGGISVIALIEESHIALHTWPESLYATLDIYSCGSATYPDIAFKHIVSKLNPKKVKSWTADRGN